MGMLGVQRFREVVEQREQAYARIAELAQALQAERAALASEKAARKRAERALEESRKAHERDLATRTVGEGDSNDLNALEAGQAPILNLGAWQRGQLGL